MLVGGVEGATLGAHLGAPGGGLVGNLAGRDEVRKGRDLTGFLRVDGQRMAKKSVHGVRLSGVDELDMRKPRQREPAERVVTWSAAVERSGHNVAGAASCVVGADI